MPLNSAVHKEKEIDGVLCRLVEENIPRKRLAFLQNILEHNGFEVKVEPLEKAGETPGDSGEERFNLWVTDVLFNPVVYVYELRLKTPDNKIVTPAYWLQKSPEGINKGEPDYYWELTKKG